MAVGPVIELKDNRTYWVGIKGALLVEQYFSTRGSTAILKRPFLARTPDEDFIEVPADFITNYASVPRGLWNLFPPWGEYAEAAVIHDYLYAGGVIRCNDGKVQAVKRKDADNIFLFLMKKLGVKWRRRMAIYWAVRIFGRFHYKPYLEVKQ